MPINNITQTISTIPEAGRRGVDVQTLFVTKQEDFQDHLQGTTVTELNTLKDQLNSRIGEINSTATTMNGYVNDAFMGSSTATTKAGEASASASAALTSRNQASTFATNSSNSATKASQWADNNYNVEVGAGKYSAKHWSVVAENVVGDTVKLTGNQTIAGIKTFSSSPIVPAPTTNFQAATKQYADGKTTLVQVQAEISTGSNLITSPTGAIGYGNGAGGTVTQLTSKSTVVNINKPTGTIYTHNESLAAGASVSIPFVSTLLNGYDLGDTLVINGAFTATTINPDGIYRVEVSMVGSGGARIRITNISGASRAEVIAINFSILRGARV